MRIKIHPDPNSANRTAADALARTLSEWGTQNLVAAGGNTPLTLYELIAQRSLPLSHLGVFALDEYVGVPPEDPRTCANLLRRTIAEPWRIPSAQFHAVSSREIEARASIEAHERRIAALGGIDVVVLGLGQNGHLGFNEPGSAPDSVGRIVELEPASIAANRAWFNGEYSPARGVTIGLKTILSAKNVFLLAYGQNKASAVANMIEGPKCASCPASWLQAQPNVAVFLDEAAAAQLGEKTTDKKRCSR
ncbi:MAG: glucosamine-6-phosphate deaminase [Verrucomicrobia bacterium]|nr:glucosamine-6-phosphate deaminase [Verrucomicrobiota bacterium]